MARYPMRVRMLNSDVIGIRILSTEYAMPIAEANELIGMIYAAKHGTVADPRSAAEPPRDRVPDAEHPHE